MSSSQGANTTVALYSIFPYKNSDPQCDHMASRMSPHVSPQAPKGKDLKTRWRVHPLGERTVWEAECRFTNATVGQFLEWQQSDGPMVGRCNPFAPFDR